MPSPTLEGLSNHLLERVLRVSAGFDASPQNDIEVRCCHCLDAKTFPFRSTKTCISRDSRTGDDVRQSISPCSLDIRSNLGPWCCKQHIPHGAGKKRVVPALALTNRRFYTIFRDTPTYVFCSEHCLEVAIKRLPLENKHLFTHVRFFERDNKQDLGKVSKESYDVDGFKNLVYVSGANTRVEYKGLGVWVKDLWRVGSKEAKRLEKRCGKKDRRWDSVGDAVVEREKILWRRG